MRVLFPLLLGLLLANCMPPTTPPKTCGDPHDEGHSCTRRVSNCGGIDRCGPTDPQHPFDDCICVDTTPCASADKLTCQDGGCPTGEFCTTVPAVPADLVMAATVSPFEGAPGLATPLTNLAIGDVIIVYASGSTQYGNEGATGCVGTPNVDPDGYRTISGSFCTPRRKVCGVGCAVPTAMVGQLIAKIGGGPWFAVGYGVIHDVGHNGPDEHGALSIAYNDVGDFAGNGGTYAVHVERVTGCSCSVVTTFLPDAAPATVQPPAFTPPDATFALSTEAPGRTAEHVVTFDSGAGDLQGYSATIAYPDAFVFNGFTAIGPVNTRIGTYAMDFDFDGVPDYRTLIRSTGPDGAYADIDLSGTLTSPDAIITRGVGNGFTIVAPNGGDQDPAHHTVPIARVIIRLAPGTLTNPPVPGLVNLSVTVTGVDPDSGGADDMQGASPESFTVEKTLAVGCDADSDCDDGIACTVDTCAAQLCSSVALVEIPGAVCALDELLADGLCGADPITTALDGVINAKVAKAKTLLGAAATAKPRKRIANIKKAEAQLAAAGRAIKAAGKKKKITTACSTTLFDLVTAKKAVLKALRST